MNSITVDSMDTNQKLKLLQLSLHYVIPKLRSTETSEKPYEDLPLFVDVEVIKSYEKTGGWTNDVVPQRNNN